MERTNESNALANELAINHLSTLKRVSFRGMLVEC